MKKVKYTGEHEVILPIEGKLVNKDDVIEVADDFFNAQFEEVIEQQPQAEESGMNE